MKKLLALVLVAGMVTFVACGPSKKDQEAKEKQKQDSINLAEKAKKEADSLANVEKLKHQKDSLKMDSMAKANKQPKGNYNYNAPKQQPTTPVVPKGTRPGATKKS
jgi:hypothetical protein